MNRWRARLAQLQSDVFVPPAHVQNVQMVQKSPSSLAFEHFEQIEQVPETSPAPQDDTWSDAEEERAATVEYDGGAPRAWAEALARLDPSKPPSGMRPQRWLRFIDDCGRFLDAGWAERAAALGWGPLHLFGCDRKRPFARVDHRGLLWEVNDGRLIELHRDRAIIEVDGGGRRIYKRQPLEVGRVVLAWELSDSSG
jgi:hypothetical protein